MTEHARNERERKQKRDMPGKEKDDNKTNNQYEI